MQELKDKVKNLEAQVQELILNLEETNRLLTVVSDKANDETRINSLETVLYSHKHKNSDLTAKLDDFIQLITTANTGFSTISFFAGTPTGTPKTGSFGYDITNNILYFNNNGTWKKTVALT